VYELWLFVVSRFQSTKQFIMLKFFKRNVENKLQKRDIKINFFLRESLLEIRNRYYDYEKKCKFSILNLNNIMSLISF